MMMLKAEIRNTMKMKRSSLTKDERIEQSLAIHHKLQELEIYLECKELFSYLSFGTEVDTWALVEKHLANNHGKKLYLPRVEGHHLNFYEMKELHTLERSRFGVPEPDESHHIPWTSAPMDTEVRVMLMPGLAFDPVGNRIGYGAGYYDRYLQDHKEADFVKVAFAYDFQVMDYIVPGPYDIPVDYILTPKRIIKCHQRRPFKQ